jgi:hypothetical protein
MATTVTRPTFFEGEILPASDLVATVNYPRAQMARHQRNLHIWGVASGLQLVAATTAGGSPTLKAGVAIDGTGREVVVSADVLLSSADFLGQVAPTNDPTTLYPVFLNGLDVPQTAASTMTGSCNTSQPTATQETYAVTYGPPGSELDVATQTAPGVTAPPSDGVSTIWKILVGFVLWDPKKNQFSGVTNYNSTNQMGIQYVGVNASEVVSGSGSVLVATHPAGFSGKSAVLALQLKEDPAGGIVFGTLNPDGSLTNVVTISSQGDITTTGQIRGAVVTGTVQVESGIATHGTVLPLPSGVTQSQVDSGAAVVHVYVSLRLTGAESTTATGSVGEFSLECYVDNLRRVHCRVRQLQLSPGFGTAITDVPAVCEYVIVASVKSK